MYAWKLTLVQHMRKSKIDCMWASMLGIQVIISSHTATASAAGMFNAPQGWHSDSDIARTRSFSARPWYVLRAPGGGTTSSSTSSAWCGPAPVPALGHQSVPNRGAVDECSDAVILADNFPRRRHPRRCRRS